MAKSLRLTSLTLAAFVAAASSVVWSQTTGASIAGRVIDGSTGKPIEGAQVDAGVGGGGQRTDANLKATTDSSGQFVFRSLAAGSRRIIVTAPGYRSGALGISSAWEIASPQTLDLKENEQRTGLLIRMWRGAVISGVVKTASGTLMVRAQVWAFVKLQPCGDARLSPAGSATTDDRGAYRIADLPPGEYIVGVRGSATGTTRPPVAAIVPGAYAPGEIRPLPQHLISIAAGDERSNVDITKPSGGATISGRLLEADGSPSARRVDLFLDEGGLQSPWEVTRAFPQPDGSFSFPPVPAGRYRLRVVEFPPVDPKAVRQMASGFSAQSNRDPNSEWPPIPDAPTVWGELPVVLGDQNVNVTMNLRTGSRLRGRVTIDDVPVTDQRRLPMVVLTSRTDYAEIGSMQASRVEADGSFTTMAVPAGSYRLRVMPNLPFVSAASTAPAKPLIMASVRLAGKDISAIDASGADVTDLVVNLTERIPDVSGTVEMNDELKSWGGRVYVFPIDERLRLVCGDYFGFGSVPVRADGSFQLTMPPGDYHVAAIVGSERDYRSPEFLKTLVPLAARVKLALGDHARVQIKPRAREVGR